MLLCCMHDCTGPPRGGWNRPQGPQNLKEPHEAFIFMIFTIISCTLFLYLSHGMDSMSEPWVEKSVVLSRLSVDKLFDACKRVEPTPLIN